MSAVSIADAWPSWGEPFTVEDLDRMPDDGRRYELIDGMLIVSPAPNMGHQRVIIVLGSLLEQACPENLVVFADIGVRIAENSALEPDVVVARVADAEGVRVCRRGRITACPAAGAGRRGALASFRAAGS